MEARTCINRVAGHGQEKECWTIRPKTFMVSQKCAPEKSSPWRNRLKIKLHLPGGAHSHMIVHLLGRGIWR